jgi:hypothetical protein
VKRPSGKDDSFEIALSEVEGKWNAVRDALKRKAALPKSVRDDILVFAAVQEARSARNRLMLAKPLTELLQIAEREGQVRSLSTDQIEAWKAGSIERHNTAVHVEGISDPKSIGMLALPAFIQTNLMFFASMRGSILTSNAGNFVTSDHPVLWFDPYNCGPNPCPSKWSLTAEVTFPLTKRDCLLLAYTPLVSRANVGEDIVATINRRSRTFADREVYATPALDGTDLSRMSDCLLGASPTASLAQIFFDPFGPGCNVRNLVRLVGAAPELFVSGNRHVASSEQLYALVS